MVHDTVRAFDGGTTLIANFPVTMNGCNLRFVTVRWSALNTGLPVVIGRGDVNTVDGATPIGDLSPAAPAEAGFFSGNGCQQPAFSAVGTAADGSNLTDIVVEYQLWDATIG